MTILRPDRRMVRRGTLALLAAVACLAGTLMLPVPLWRTGRMPVAPLTLIASNPPRTQRIWVDTDAACGFTARTDVDDCLALWLLLNTRIRSKIVAVATVHGNASLEVTDNITRALVKLLNSSPGKAIDVWRGSRAPINRVPVERSPAATAITRALEEGPVTILALGPLTNLAHVLTANPHLASNVAELIAVMGRRPGHLFHPSEGIGRGSFLGHGPVFRDFNFSEDPEAVEELLAMNLKTTLLPYDVATNVEITSDDLRRLAAHGKAGEWLAARARSWLEYWHSDIGREGFYPFDLMAAAYLLAPSLFRCADVQAWVGKDPILFAPLFRATALLVEPNRTHPAGRTTYCPEVEREFAARLHDWISAPS
jgi:purine nucleosidase